MSTNGKIRHSDHNIDTLYDSETNEMLSADDLGISEARYEELVEKSVKVSDTGHVVIEETGRKVYAAW